MKRMIVLVIVLICTMAVMGYAEEGIKQYTYESALETAVNNSNQPALDDYNIKALESALEDAIDESKKGFIGGTPQEVVERTLIKEVKPFEAEVKLEIGKKEKLDHENKMKEEVFQQMMNVVYSEERIRLKKERIELIREKHDIDQKRFQEGFLSEMEIADADLELSIEQLELVKMETSLKADVLDVKQKLHVDLSEENQIGFEYQLLKIGSPYLLDSFDLDAAIGKVRETNTAIYGKEMQLEIAEREMQITQKYLKPGNDYYDRMTYKLESAKKQLYDEKTGLEVSIRNAYNDLLTSRDALDVEAKKEELGNNRLSALEEKLKAGVISRRDIIDTELGVLAQKQATLQAIYEFNLKNEALRALLED